MPEAATSRPPLLALGADERGDWAAAFRLRNAQEVTAFVEVHPAVRDRLLEAPTKIRESFGQGVEMCLELVRDIDSPGAEELFLLVRTDLPVGEALAAMSRLDEAWWLDAVAGVEGLMNIDIEHI